MQNLLQRQLLLLLELLYEQTDEEHYLSVSDLCCHALSFLRPVAAELPPTGGIGARGIPSCKRICHTNLCLRYRRQRRRWLRCARRGFFKRLCDFSYPPDERKIFNAHNSKDPGRVIQQIGNSDWFSEKLCTLFFCHDTDLLLRACHGMSSREGASLHALSSGRGMPIALHHFAYGALANSNTVSQFFAGIDRRLTFRQCCQKVYTGILVFLGVCLNLRPQF